MITALIVYVIGVVFAFTALIKRLVRTQSEMTVQDVFYSLVFSVLSWIGFVLFDEDFGEFIVTAGEGFSKVGKHVIWRKKNDKPVPGRDEVAVQLPRNPNNI